MEFDITWESIFGGAVVAVYALARFNTPPTSRYSTTTLQYLLGATIYTFAALVLYELFIGIPHVVLHLPVIDGLQPAASSVPLIVALVLTNALEIFSPLTRVDHAIRRQCHRFAAIPHRALALSAHLQTNSYSPPEANRTKVVNFLVASGFSKEDVVFGDSSSPQQLWTRLTFLMQCLKTSDALAGFRDSHTPQLELLQHRYREALQPVVVAFDTARRVRAGELSEASHLLEAVRATLQNEIEKLLQDVCDLIARGVLRCSLIQRVRDLEVRSMGFSVSHEGFTNDQHLALLFLISGMLLFFMVLTNPASMTLSARLSLGVAVSVSNWVAIMIAVVSKESRWRLAQPDREDFRPVKYYAAVFIMTALSSTLIRVLFRLINYPLPVVVHSFPSWAPWVLIDVSTATMIAFHTDNKPRPGLRWLEAGAQAAGTMVVAVIVHQLLVALGSSAPPLSLLLIEMTLFGFALGYCVPTWYRGAPRRSAIESITPRPPAATRAAA